MVKFSALKPELIFFSEYKLGGVQSFHYNLLKYDPFGKIKKTWLLERHALDEDAIPPQPFRVIPDERIIQFARGDSYNDKAKKIAAELTDAPGAFITNFLEELMAIQYFTSKPKTVFYVCHDEGYVETAVQYEFLIDVFIAHNPFFYDELNRLMPHRKDTVFYLPYGIKRAEDVRVHDPKAPLNILYLARIHKLKGIYELPRMDDHLIKSGIRVNWTIIGDGAGKDAFRDLIKGRDNFNMLTLNTQEDVLKECSKQDIFILPSYKDGLPVAMLESMSAGVVPVMYRFNEGINRIITDEHGFLTETGNWRGLTDAIEVLEKDRNLLMKMSASCYNKVKEEYDVRDRAKSYYELFYQYDKFKRKKKIKFVRHSGWLDLPFIPSFLRKMARQIKSSFKLRQG